MELLLGIFSAFGLSASAGLNAYIPLLLVGAIAHYTDWITLSPPFDTLENPWILMLIGVLLLVEMLADKVPAVNHLNDAIQTFVRPAAGAVAFAASAKVVTGISPVLALACGLLVAGGVHLVKAAAVRPMITATTGGAGNVPVSLTEDAVSAGTSILAIFVPLAIAGLLILLVFVLSWLWARPQDEEVLRKTVNPGIERPTGTGTGSEV